MGGPFGSSGTPLTEMIWKAFWWMWKGWMSSVRLISVHSSTVFNRGWISGTFGNSWPWMGNTKVPEASRPWSKTRVRFSATGSLRRSWNRLLGGVSWFGTTKGVTGVLLTTAVASVTEVVGEPTGHWLKVSENGWATN